MTAHQQQPLNSDVFRKHDGTKAPMHYVPARALRLVAQVMGHGAEKYGALNWTLCREPERYVAAALRHLNEQVAAYQAEGVMRLEIDDESLLPSLAHAAASCLLALELMLPDEFVEIIEGKTNRVPPGDVPGDGASDGVSDVAGREGDEARGLEGTAPRWTGL